MQSILVALDTSPRASVVLERAAAIARATRAELTLLRVVGLPHDVPQDAYRLSPNDLVEKWKSEAHRELERAAGALSPGLVVHLLVHVGGPWSTICTVARERNVDLIVIGSHGYDALDHVLGTTAAKVVNHSDRSVLVVRDPKPAAIAAR
jgi:nucleotide-binding universal stress UspA family protein